MHNVNIYRRMVLILSTFVVMGPWSFTNAHECDDTLINWFDTQVSANPRPLISQEWRRVLRRTDWKFYYFDHTSSDRLFVDTAIRVNVRKRDASPFKKNEIKEIKFLEIFDDTREAIEDYTLQTPLNYAITESKSEYRYATIHFKYLDSSRASPEDKRLGSLKIYKTETGKSFEFEDCSDSGTSAVSGHSRGGGRG